MPRLMLTDELWSKLWPIMSQNGIYDKPDLRHTTEGILYKMRVGCPWRDLPQEHWSWKKVYSRFNDWSKYDKLKSIFLKLVVEPDMEWKIIDGSVVKAHQHACGARKDAESGIGKTAGGNSSKIHMVVDSHANPIDFEITEGQVHDIKMAPELIERTPHSTYTIADKGYDGEYLRWVIRGTKSIPVIPRKENSKIGNTNLDKTAYRERYKVENIFARLKHYMSIATRFDKLKRNYKSMLSLACAYIWLKL
ncbi:MAG: IS5 family transposase [Halobacteriovoraceae bacterium]|nr:IS5 family transposase [Halobacteriovoraceae bacterium]